MAINRAKVATERQKMKLQSAILADKVAIEERKIALKKRQDELKQLKGVKHT